MAAFYTVNHKAGTAEQKTEIKMFGKLISDLMIKSGKSSVFETPEKYKLVYEDVN